MSILNSKRQSKRRTGLGLVEVIVSSLVVGVMLVAALETLGAVLRTQKANSTRLVGPNLAMELMSEIMSQPYKDPQANGSTLGLDSGESTGNRVAFDDVDDYANYDQIGIEDKDGSSRIELSNWRQQVEVRWMSLALGILNDILETDLKRIVVTVTSPTGEVSTLTAFRSKVGMLEQAPATDMMAATWVGARLQLGATTLPQFLGTNLKNHVPDPN